jgi:hypothetical protein
MVIYTSPPNVATAIRAELIGSDRAMALGIEVNANAPVLELCRKLIAGGHDPAAPLHAYRGLTLCLKVRSIGEGARLRINGSGVGFYMLPVGVDGRPFDLAAGAAVYYGAAG